MRLCLAFALLMLASSAFAQTMGSTSGASSMVDINSPATTTNHLITTPTVAAPGLAAAGVETCLGSTAGGLSLMGGGFTFGTTKVDEGCTIRLLARQLYAFGFHTAALALMCQDEHVALAMQTTGAPCPAPPGEAHVDMHVPVSSFANSPLDSGDITGSLPATPPPAPANEVGPPLSILPEDSFKVPAAEAKKEPVRLSAIANQYISPEEQAWFDRASNTN